MGTCLWGLPPRKGVSLLEWPTVCVSRPVGEYDPGVYPPLHPSTCWLLANEVSVKPLSPFWIMAFVR